MACKPNDLGIDAEKILASLPLVFDGPVLQTPTLSKLLRSHAEEFYRNNPAVLACKPKPNKPRPR